MRCRASARNFTRSFSLHDFLFTLGKPNFRNTWECYSIFDQHVMKYFNFCSSGSKLESVTWSLLKIAIFHRCFSKNFAISAEQRYWKMYFHGCFWEQLYFGNFPECLLLKDSCKDIFILEILSYKYFTFLTVTSC